MAKVEVKMPEEFLLKLSRLGERTDEIIPKVLEAGGEVVLSKVKSNLQSVIGSGTKYPSRATGELVSALGLSPVKQDRDGNHNIKVGFTEPRRMGPPRSRKTSWGEEEQRSGRAFAAGGKTSKAEFATTRESNAKIANIIEYGKSGQPAKPFLKPAKSATRKSCIEVMKSRLEQELGCI